IVAGPGLGLDGVQFPVKVPLVTVSFMTAVVCPRKFNRFALTPDAAVVEMALPDIVRSVSVPELLVIWIWNSQLFAIEQLVMLVGFAPPVAVPVRPASRMPESSVAALSPLVEMTQLSIFSPLSVVPLMPLSALLWIFISERKTLF